jgi:hypothetical protein
MKEACFAFLRLTKEISDFSALLTSDPKLQSKLRAPFQQVKEKFSSISPNGANSARATLPASTIAGVISTA